MLDKELSFTFLLKPRCPLLEAYSELTGLELIPDYRNYDSLTLTQAAESWGRDLRDDYLEQIMMEDLCQAQEQQVLDHLHQDIEHQK